MTTGSSDQEAVLAAHDRYLAVFQDLDAVGCAGCFRTPLAIASASGVIRIDSHDALVSWYESALADLERSEYGRTDVLDREVTLLDHSRALVRMTGERHTRRGDTMGTIAALYSFGRAADGQWLIDMVTALTPPTP